MSRPQAPQPPHSGAQATEAPNVFTPGAPFSKGGSDTVVAPLVLPEPAHQALLQLLNARLQTRTHGLCFSPYLDGQGPGTLLAEPQIRARMEVIAPHTRWVRSFSCTEGNELIPKVAHDLGLKTLVGAWLGADLETNEREIDGLIAVARAGHADIVAVGNEVMLREDLSEDALLAYIARVKAALPGIRVGYVDAYY